MNRLTSLIIPICAAATRPLYCAMGNSCDQSSVLYEGVVSAGTALVACASCSAAKWTWRQLQNSDNEVAKILRGMTPQNAKAFVQGLKRLHQEGLLTRDNFCALTRDPQNALWTAQCFIHLNRAGLLTQDTRNALIQNSMFTAPLCDGLAVLNQDGILTQNNFDALMRDPQSALTMAMGLGALNIADILMQDTRNVLIQNPDCAMTIAQGLRALNRADILTQDNINALARNPHTPNICMGFIELNESRILTQDNFNILMQNSQIADDITTGLIALHEPDPDLLTQENFNKLLRGNAVCTSAIANMLHRIPWDERNQELFDAIVDATMEREWAFVRRAATIFGQGLRTNSWSLPPHLSAKIAAKLAPQYENAPPYEKMARRIIWEAQPNVVFTTI